VAEWPARRTRNRAVHDSSSPLATTWICLTVPRSSNSGPRLQLTNWFASGQLEFLTSLCSVGIIFLLFANLYAMKTAKCNKVIYFVILFYHSHSHLCKLIS